MTPLRGIGYGLGIALIAGVFFGFSQLTENFASGASYLQVLLVVLVVARLGYHLERYLTNV